MKKVLTIGTISVLIAQLFTSLAGVETGFSLLMGVGPAHDIARVVLVVALIAIAVTARPRSKMLRMSFAFVAVNMVLFTLSQTLNYGFLMLDTMTYLLAATLIMIEAIEVEPKPVLSSAKLAHAH